MPSSTIGASSTLSSPFFYSVGAFSTHLPLKNLGSVAALLAFFLSFGTKMAVWKFVRTLWAFICVTSMEKSLFTGCPPHFFPSLFPHFSWFWPWRQRELKSVTWSLCRAFFCNVWLRALTSCCSGSLANVYTFRHADFSPLTANKLNFSKFCNLEKLKNFLNHQILVSFLFNSIFPQSASNLLMMM